MPLPPGRLDGVGYFGLNHLGWLYRLESGGRDSLPGLLADADALAGFEEGRLFPQPFLRELGLLPNEYLFYYYETARAAAGMRAMAQTRGESIHTQQAELYPRLAAAGDEAYGLWEAARRSREEGYLAEARTGGEARHPEDLAGGGYEQVALSVMRAVAGAADAGGGGAAGTELILNTPNFTGRSSPVPGGTQAAIPGLPADAVVEVPCTVTSQGAVPIPQDRPAEPQLDLLRQVKNVELLTVRAATSGDRDAAREAFAGHPLVGSAELADALLTGYEGAFPGLAGLWRR